ncbi:CGNR zinc finger domain-containing protein [Amycolatopsis methanolica]|uniref:CGNR zinc finger domain-containing protein n=1 Tax=Amycolatopsis methanolica TaxID=1814 RepID=UPI003441018E
MVKAQWVFDGGRPCLDLVNTLRDRHRGGRELLTSPSALVEWLVLAGLLPRPVTAPADSLAVAIALREAVDRVARGAGRPVDVRLLNRHARNAPVPQLRIDGDGVAHRRLDAPDPVEGAFGTLAVDAIDLATSEADVRICAYDDCGLRFADTSPKRNRQWCSMSRCGNRAKARAHYARIRGR